MDRLRSLTVVSVAVGALAAAACGTLAAPTAPGAAGSSPAPSASPQAAGSAAAASCSLTAVTISLDSAASGVAAGSTYVPLEFANVSASTCLLPSFPGVTFASGAGGPAIGPPAVQRDQTQAQSLVLAPGQLAHSWLQIAAAASYPPASCDPVTAQGLLISLTSVTQTSFVADSVPACAQLPAGSPILTVFPVRAGQAHRGTIP